ncbi:MAG: alpha/beta fold hydrolase [Candidatus Rokuibacteriota bacterium]
MRTNHRLEGPAGAPVVTLSHSLGASLALWDATAPALPPRYRVLRYDVRGHGGSDVPPGPYTLEQMADDVATLLRAQGISRTHFVGMSMGGLVGMTFALRHAPMTQSLTLCDTTACYGAERAPMWEERIRVAETAGMTDALIERTMEIWFSPDFLEKGKAVVDRVRAMLRGTDPRGYAAAIRAIGFVDLREAIRAIRCPTLVVVGEQDGGTSPAMARVMAEAIAGARLEVLKGARHAAVVECAGEFNRRLGAFLASA